MTPSEKKIALAMQCFNIPNILLLVLITGTEVILIYVF